MKGKFLFINLLENMVVEKINAGRQSSKPVSDIIFKDIERLADSSQDAIYHYDLESQHFHFINKAFIEIFRLPAETGRLISIGKVLLVIHPDDRDTMLQAIDQSLEAGLNKGEVQYRVVYPDGTMRWLQDRWIVLRDSKDGRPLSLEGFIRDNTEIRIADTQLIDSRQKALIGSYIVQDGKFRYVNPEFIRITGFSEDELLGTDPMVIVHEDYRDLVRQNAVAMLKGHSDMPYVFCVRDKNGQAHWVLETVTSVAHGGRQAALGYFMDISELRRMQGNLSTLGLMIGTISHSLRSCLTGLDASLYLIETGFYRNKPARIEEGIDVTKLMVDRIRKLVLDILYYSKERDIKLETTEVWRFSKDLAESMEARIRAADIIFETDFPKNIGKFRVDVNILRPALINILENAMEACIEDHRPLAHRIRFCSKGDADQITFEISDNGPGMDEDQSHQIFKLFYSSKGTKGTGIGLFVTRKVISEHGGSITVETKPGNGARFVITLPRQMGALPSTLILPDPMPETP
ncbi:MAG: PAS domain S-box protein [Proteobacteria bacterium]|nr:PAS domain S-box protein [Pseudomonadota bacterium]